MVNIDNDNDFFLDILFRKIMVIVIQFLQIIMRSIHSQKNALIQRCRWLVTTHT